MYYMLSYVMMSFYRSMSDIANSQSHVFPAGKWANGQNVAQQ